MTTTEGWRWKPSVRRLAAVTAIGAVAATSLTATIAGADDTPTPSLPTTYNGVTVSDLLTQLTTAGRFRRHDEFKGDAMSRVQTLGDVSKAIRSERATSGTANGRGIDVALVDTGVSPVGTMSDPS